MNDAVLIERDGAVAELILNRPEAMNALNDEMVEGLLGAVTELAEDQGVRCVVIRGAGDRFMAGGDLKQFHEYLRTVVITGNPFPINFDRAHGAIEGIRGMRKPVIASVRGPAAGFGMSLVCACDLAIAADDAFFTLAYCLIGTSPDGGSTFHLPRAVGLKRAMEMALLGDRFDAEAALAHGLINRVVPATELVAETAKLARRLAAGPTRALANAKHLLNESFHSSLREQLDREAGYFLECTGTADFAEGIDAFINKRKAEFTGS